MLALGDMTSNVSCGPRGNSLTQFVNRGQLEHSL